MKSQAVCRRPFPAVRIAFLAISASALLPTLAVMADEVPLIHRSSLEAPELKGVVDLAASPDGKTIYASAFKSKTLATLKWDVETKTLTPDTWIRDKQLGTTVSVAASPDGRWLAASSISTRSIVLCEVTADGVVRIVDRITGPDIQFPNFAFPTEVAFSPDSKFIYTCLDRVGAIVVLKIGENEDGRLEGVQQFSPGNGCLNGSRGLAMTKDGEYLFAASREPGNIVAMKRDKDTGQLTMHHRINSQDGIYGAAIAFDVCLSPKDDSVYAVGGRFKSAGFVGSFDLGAERRLGAIQQFSPTRLANFVGGNGICASPDGKYVFASGTESRSIAAFARDPETHRLELLGVRSDETTGRGSTLGPCGMLIVNKKYLLVTLEDRGSIEVFEIGKAEEESE